MNDLKRLLNSIAKEKNFTTAQDIIPSSGGPCAGRFTFLDEVRKTIGAEEPEGGHCCIGGEDDPDITDPETCAENEGNWEDKSVMCHIEVDK